MATFKWYQYAFTEARAIFTYIRMTLCPVDLSLDHDFATSYTILEHGALYYMILLAALVALSLVWRRRYPLFCFGLLSFLIWLAPTSSIIPLDDALVERRMYLPLACLILICCEIAMRVRISRTVGVAALALLATVGRRAVLSAQSIVGRSGQAFGNWLPQARYTTRGHCSITPRS